MAKISQQTIDEIINASDIVEVIGEYVQLQPAGKSYKGLCPFHQEKTPSFMVSKERKIFNCFSCGEKGNVAGFLMKYKSLTFIEALKTLADRYHVPLEIDTTNAPIEKFNRLYEINRTALDYYQLALTNLEIGKQPLDYLLKRGLDIKTIQAFEIGFSPNEQDALYKNLKSKYQELDMLDIGLIKKNPEGHYYDLFRNRIIFPIKNAQGKVVAFSGRLYQKNDNEPKYVNSPFTQIFTKGEVLFNLDKALPVVKQTKRLILYEGFMDVIASVRAGFKESIATMGTALTKEQAQLIKKYTNNVILCYDGDSAGFEAMMKAIQLLQNEELIVSLVVLPEQLDPDEYVKKYSNEKYRDYINSQQIDPFEFRYQYLKRHADLSKTGGIERFKLTVFDLLKSSSATETEIYLKKLASDTQIDFVTIRTDYRDYRLSKTITKNQEQAMKKTVFVGIPQRYYLAEKTLLNYYIENEGYRMQITNELTDVFCTDELNLEILMNVNDILDDNPKADSLKDKILSRFKDNKLIKVKLVLEQKNGFSQLELDHCINQIKERSLDLEIKALKEKQMRLDTATKSAEYIDLNNQILSIKQRKEILWKKTKSSKN